MRLVKLLLALLLYACLCLTVNNYSAAASPLVASPSLEAKFRVDESGTASVDFNQITFADLGSVANSGKLENLPNLSIPIARTWQVGDALATVLHLADIPSLSPQQFSIAQIAAVTDRDLSSIKLSDLPLIGQQSITDLVKAIPYLENIEISAVKPIAALMNGALSASQPIKAALTQPELARKKLESLGPALTNYTLADLPNAIGTPIDAFAGWEAQPIAAIPGLERVPLASMPIPLAKRSASVARIASMSAPAPQRLTNTVSGSAQVGFRIACPERSVIRGVEFACGGIALDNVGQVDADADSDASLEGKQWVLGSIQSVEGGNGDLQLLKSGIANVEPGFEPTGRHPFGSLMKQVLETVNDAQSTVTSSLVFRVCADDSCSPYNQFKVPFIDYQINDLIVIGTDTLADSGSSGDPAAIANASSDNTSRYQTARSGVCIGESIAGISVEMLSDAISGQSKSVSPTAASAYICATDGRCGRALGQFSAFSHQPQVKAAIESVSGGSDWLASLAKGHQPTTEEMLKFYPPETQRRLVSDTIKDLLSRNAEAIDPTTSQPFAQGRLVERIGQQWSGGVQTAVDSAIATSLQGLSIAQYGSSIRKSYEAIGGSYNLNCGNDLAIRLSTNEKITQAVDRMGAISTASAPTGSEFAQAWAINQVLKSAGIAPLGGDKPDYVPALADELDRRRGTLVTPDRAQAGDIVVAPGQEHIGICLTPGCTKVRSTSAQGKAFDWDSDSTFDGIYTERKIYRLTQ